MRTRRIIEIKTETEELVVVRGPRPIVARLCGECPDPVAMVTAEEAAAIYGVSIRLVYRWVEANAIHFADTGGAVLVCPRCDPRAG